MSQTYKQGFAVLPIGQHEIVAPFILRRVQNRHAPFFGAVFQPVLKLIGNLRQYPPGHSFSVTIGVEETKHTLGLLERLDQSVQQKTVETPIPELDAILMMLDEDVHGTLLCGEIRGAYRRERLLFYGHFQTSPDVSGSAGMAEGSPVRTGSLRPHRGLSQAGD